MLSKSTSRVETEVRGEKPKSVSRGQAPGGKRQEILQNAAKRRLLGSLYYMRGLLQALSQEDLAKATALMAPDEVTECLATAHAISQRARTFERKLREMKLLRASRDVQSGDFEEIAATDSGGAL
jgi:hypothetical protein